MHCVRGNSGLDHQIMFDVLDEVMDVKASQADRGQTTRYATVSS